MPADEGVIEFDTPASNVTADDTTSLGDAFEEASASEIEIEPEDDGDTSEVTVEDTVEGNWWDDYLDKTVTVKVAGQDVEVPFQEALKGYSRQADYTRKTSDLAAIQREAEWGQAMKEALHNDPVETIVELAKAFGINLNVGADADLGEEAISAYDAREARFRAEMDQRFAPVEAQAEISRMQAELNSLGMKYKDDFNVSEVISYVQEQAEQGFEVGFEQAFFTLQGQKAYEAKQAEARRKKADTTQRRVGATQQKATVNPAAPSSRSTSGVSDDLSLRQIFELVSEGAIE